MDPRTAHVHPPRRRPPARPATLDARATRSRSGENGIAIALVIVCLVLATLVLGVVISASTNALSGGRTFGQRLDDGAQAKVGLEAIRNAIASDRSVGDLYAIDATQVASALASHGPTGWTKVASSSLAYQPPADVPDIAMRGPVKNGATPYWQVVALRPPDPAAGRTDLDVTVRGWWQSSQRATDSQAMRAQLHVGTFADFQVLSDGPVKFAGAAKVTGRVHSNGLVSDVDLPPAAQPRMRVWRESGTVTCSGADAEVTTAVGLIDSAIKSSTACRAREAAGQMVPVSRGVDALRHVQELCGTTVARAIVRCYSTPGTYDVTLSGYSATVSPGGTITWSAGTSATIYVAGTARVRGTANGRVTIASGTSGTPGGGRIEVIGSTVGASASDPLASVGLMAEDSVIMSPTTCVQSLNAAIVAVSGTVSIADVLKQPLPISPASIGAGATCGPLRVFGSVSSHTSPVLQWQWGSGNAGYSSRSFDYDARLKLVAPPFMPLSDDWELVGVEQANADCWTGANTCT